MRKSKTRAQILEVLREQKRPMCAREIALALPEAKEITIHKGLQKLLENDVIRVAGKVQNTKNYARTYSINPQYEEKLQDEYLRILSSNFHFVCNFVKKTPFSDEELAVLRRILDERIKKES